MFSFLAAILIAIASLFSTNAVEPIEYANDIPAKFDTTNPIDITTVHVDDLSYEEFDFAVENCFIMYGDDEVAGHECTYILAVEYPEFGMDYYSDLTMRLGYVNSYANDFFTYYDTIHSRLNA